MNTSHFDLPVHPFTGLRAIGVLPKLGPVWPVLGAAGDGDGDGGADGGAGDGGAGQGGQGGDGGQGGAGQTFTQADLDRIINERLGRERSKYADYDALKGKATKFDELTAAQKTEAQRQQDALEEALGKASSTELALWKERAARRHKLDEDLLPFLTGTTEAEVEERAKTLAAKTTPGPAGGQRRPAPDPSQGRGAGKGGAGGSVSAGRDLYKQRHTKKT